MRNLILALTLATSALVAAEKTEPTKNAEPASVVIAKNPLFGEIAFPDMAMARFVAPVIARLKAASMPMCQSEGLYCESLIERTTYETIKK